MALVILMAVEVTAHFAAEHVGAPRKAAMLRGMTMNKEGKEVPGESFGAGRDNQYLSPEERRLFAKEYAEVVDGSVYAQRTIFNFTPNYAGRFLRTDERGFRIVPQPPQPAAKRVAFLGGSVIWGTATETNADTVPAKFQSLSQGRFETINYGMGGYSSVENVLMLNSLLVRDHPKRPIDAVVVADIWNECIPAIVGLETSVRFASDGLGPAISGHTGVFLSELRRDGILTFNPAQSFQAMSRKVSDFFGSAILGATRQIVERERVWRLIRLIRDPEFMPWYCCGKEEEVPDPLASIAPDVYVAKVDASLDVFENNITMMRALAEKHGVKIFFAINPMAFDKKNPAPGEYLPTSRDKLYQACFARARARFARVGDVIDMSDTPMPDGRAFADTGHMNRLGNEAYAAELLRRLGPRLQ